MHPAGAAAGGHCVWRGGVSVNEGEKAPEKFYRQKNDLIKKNPVSTTSPALQRENKTVSVRRKEHAIIKGCLICVCMKS